MYITSELFTSPGPTSSPGRDSIADGQPTGLGKRKRRVDNGEPITVDSSSSHKAKSQFVGSRSLGFALPGSQYTYPRFKAALLGTRPIKQARRTSQRTIINADIPLSSEIVPNAQYHIPPTHLMTSACDLRPCHICHKAPIRWREVENYTSCQDCDGRVCYVCARTCAGNDCTRELCSRCCKELGEDGEAWCTKCVVKTGHGS